MTKQQRRLSLLEQTYQVRQRQQYLRINAQLMEQRLYVQQIQPAHGQTTLVPRNQEEDF